MWRWQLLVLVVCSAHIEQCCRRGRVSEVCVRLLCNPNQPPNDFDVYNIFDRKTNCVPYMDHIAACLADGRNHTHCCSMQAKDRDENACFGLCWGQGMQHVVWDKYQTCLAINLDPIFTCFQQGYVHSPSPPQAVHVTSTSTNSAMLNWLSPSSNNHLVHSYLVVWNETDTHTLHSVETKATTVSLSGLRADSKYSVFVVALTKDSTRRSLPSSLLTFHTAGVEPRLTAYRHTVATPKHAHSVTLACRMLVTGTSSARVEWHKLNEHTARFDVLPVNERFSPSNYMCSDGQPRHLVTTLYIHPVDVHDLGMYRCVVHNQFGSSTANIRLVVGMVTAARAVPPESPFACCQRQGIRPPCSALCGTEYGKRTSLRAEAFLNNGCEHEMNKLLSCSVEETDEGACCLRRKVPSACLSLCGASEQTAQMPMLCADHTLSIFQCRMEEADNRPATVTHLIAHSQGDSVLVEWNSTERAHVYHVYSKRKGTAWQVSSVLGTSKRLNAVDEVVVVASNGFGNAHAARLKLDAGSWLVSYY